VEAAPGFEPGIRALQARALPLGYAAADGGSNARRRHSQFEENTGSPHGRLASPRDLASVRAVQWLILFVGGGIGAILRFALAVSVDQRSQVPFPWGTLAVNVAGCFAIGLLVAVADGHRFLGPGLRLFLIAGVLGGFTTFSTFGLETVQLVEDGLMTLALLNAFGSLLASLLAVLVGLAVGRSFS
jgi:CrcB protein